MLENAMVKYLATAKGTHYRETSTAALCLNVLIALFTALVLLIFSGFLSAFWETPALKPLLQLYAITTLVFVVFQQSNFTQQANLDFRGIFWSNFVRKGLFFLYILIYFTIPGLELKLINLVIVQIFTTLAGSLTSLWIGLPHLRFSKYIKWNLVGQLFHYGKFVMGTNISAMIYKTIDKIMLGSLLSPVAVALYEAAVRINSLLEVPTYSIAAIVFPESSRRTENSMESDVAMLYEKAVGATLSLIFPATVFIWIFAYWIVWVIAGETYLEAIPLLRWTILYGLFVPFSIQFGTILDSVGRPKINFAFTILGAILNILLNYLGIRWFGIMGAPIGTLITYAITFTMMQVALNRMYQVKTYRVFYYMLTFYKELFKIISDRVNMNLKLIRNS